jgi:hypothetical protein
MSTSHPDLALDQVEAGSVDFEDKYVKSILDLMAAWTATSQLLSEIFP